jgi:tetratricopeptide (TPR) repeat protein
MSGPVAVTGGAAGWLAIACALALAGCFAHAPQGYTCPARGGPTWRELTSEHFVVDTDRQSGGARALVEELEIARAALVAAAFRGAVDPPGRLHVVAFDRREDLPDPVPEEVLGWFGVDLGGEPLVVMAGVKFKAIHDTVAHELAHQLAATLFVRQPRWFSEGIATYLETVTADGDRVLLGAASRQRRREAGIFKASSAQLFAWTGELEPRYYGNAWLLVHFLVNQRGGRFSAYQVRLSRAEDPVAAWAAEFPEYDPGRPGALERLDGDLTRYAEAGQYTVVSLPFERPAVNPAERALDAGEAHALRLTIPSQDPGARPEARDAEIAEALREDPGHPAALALKARRLPSGERAALAREAVETHPRSWRAWALLGTALPDGDRAGRLDALRRAVELAPDNPRALDRLARELVAADRAGEALSLARRAIARAPWNAVAFDTAAAANAALGNCADALQLEQRAVDLLPEHLPVERRRELLRALDDYRARCGPGQRSLPGDAAHGSRTSSP